MSGSKTALLTRRELLGAIGTMMATSPFVVWSQRARGMYNMGAFWKKKKAGSGSFPVLTDSGDDPYWDYVTLLMQMEPAKKSDGSSDTNVLADESNVGTVAVTPSGSPYIATGAGSGPYSSIQGSVVFNGSSLLTVPSSVVNFGSSDFTIEFWINRTSSTGWIWGDYTSWSGDVDVLIRLGGGSCPIQFCAGGNATSTSLYTTTTIPAGTWTHVAFVRNGNTIKAYINGVQDATTLSYSGSVVVKNATHYMGKCRDGSEGFTGSIADFRIYKGVAKYNSSFNTTTKITAPVPIGLGSSADPYWGYCALACPFENTMKDMSGKQATRNGAVALSSVKSKFGTVSCAFPGNSGDYIDTPTSSDFGFGTGDFTIEGWVNPPALSSAQYIFDARISGANDSTQMALIANTGNGLRFVNQGNYQITSGSSVIPANQWTHFAISRQSGQTRLFAGGVLLGTFADTVDYPSTRLRIGSFMSGTGNMFSGNLDSLRVTKGFARYTANFTPPTGAFPVGKDETLDPFWDNTVLALMMDNLSDSAGGHSVTTNNITNSASGGRFGGGSADFNGSSSYMRLATSSEWYPTTDWTVEAWIKPSGFGLNSGWRHIVSQYDNSYQLSWYFALYADSANMYLSADYRSSGSLSYNLNSAPLTTGKWYHVALSKLGSKVWLFLDGRIVASSTLSQTPPTSSGPLWIGCQSTGDGGYFNGSMDDLRITKGIARYQHNFTPPTRSFVSVASTYPASAQAFASTGAAQTYTVPAGVNRIRVKAWGAGGGPGPLQPGGGGGCVVAEIPVAPGETLEIRVGGRGREVMANGSNGGSAPYGGGGIGGLGNAGGSGGGYSGIFRGSTPLVVAGAGGGGDHHVSGYGGPGGEVGAAGGSTYPGGGGTATSGGAGATVPNGGVYNGTSGSYLQGGKAGDGNVGADPRGGGGGGGGYYGGGGGGGTPDRTVYFCGGGGGGSSYAAPSCRNITMYSGSGATPGNSGDSDRSGAGAGGSASGSSDTATGGRIVIY